MGFTVLMQAAGPAGDPRAPLVPTWIAMTAAVITLGALAYHMAALPRVKMPPSRRRIRTVNGWLMLAAIPLVTYAFGFAVPSQTRAYVLVWAGCIGLLAIIVLISLIDAANNVRLYRRSADALRREFHGVMGRTAAPGNQSRPTDADDVTR